MHWALFGLLPHVTAINKHMLTNKIQKGKNAKRKDNMFQASLPDWCHNQTPCAAAAVWVGPGRAPEERSDRWKAAASDMPLPLVPAGTRRLLLRSEAHRRLVGAPWATQQGSEHRQEIWYQKGRKVDDRKAIWNWIATRSNYVQTACECNVGIYSGAM